MIDLSELKSVRDFREKTRDRLPQEIFDYLVGGADDMKTSHRNTFAFEHYQLRPRRLVDVSIIDTSIEILGEKWKTQIALAPVGLQGYFHEEGEVATAKAAQALGHQMVVSTVSSFSYVEIASHFDRNPWFQLYPTNDRKVTQALLKQAESNGCKVLVLTVDVPVLGNRQKHSKHLAEAIQFQTMRLGNLAGFMGNTDLTEPSLTWDFIIWLREQCDMKIVIKGIMTHEDAAMCLQFGVDGLVVSNHGGRQLESGLSSLEVLKEIAEIVNGQIPVLFDGGIRRGTDILKALALGANAVFLGRAFCYGLAVAGEAGVNTILKILEEELKRDMMLLGAKNVKEVSEGFVQKRRF